MRLSLHSRACCWLATMLLCLFTGKIYATHIFGMDLYYTHVSGLTYNVNLVVYGDCAGSAFFTLSGASPVIDIYNGGTYINSVNLSIQPPAAGLEVTPVCASRASGTTCINPSYTIPGVKKFVYSANVTLSSTSTVWRFLFNGRMGGTSTAGRSTSITNISIGTSGAPIQLVDTLNNSGADNSSAVYTSIPTPFYCINNTSNFNPAAVDPEGDVLDFSLVPGMDASTSSSVPYVWPYSATAPLAASSGSFSFSSTTGQISFYPNVVQRSLVVYNVRETRGGVLRGTSQREMTVVVLSPCTNTPPVASISSPSAGSVTGGTNLSICSNADSFYFNINPTDADGDTIAMSISGLPSGATFGISNNNTRSPSGRFAWNTRRAAPGIHTFYITLLDNGCPTTSNQTIAFTVTILPAPTGAGIILTGASCTRQARVHFTGSGTGPLAINVLSGTTSVRVYTGVTSTVSDSLPAGNYTVRFYDPTGCTFDTSLNIVPPAPVSFSISSTGTICPGTATGTITVAGASDGLVYSYSLDTAAYGSSGVYTGVSEGRHTVHVRDSRGCRHDTVITIRPPAPILANIGIRNPDCNGVHNGSITVTAYNSIAPYTYALNSGSFVSIGSFGGLASGRDTLHIRNAVGCQLDTIITLVDSITLGGTVYLTPIMCYGGDATAIMNAIGGFGGPYTYSYDTFALDGINIKTVPGSYHTFHIRDGNNCAFDTFLRVPEPPVLYNITTATGVTCHASATASITITGSGGMPGYTYSLNGSAFTTTGVFSGLVAGNYITVVKDTNGCMINDTLTLTDPAPLVFDSINISNASCFGYNDGSIRVFASGGGGRIVYGLNDTSRLVATSFFAGLSAGVQTVYIKDNLGCLMDSAVVLTQPGAIIPSVAIVQPLCSTLHNGQVTLSATGGRPGYTYAPAGGLYSDTGTYTNLAAGTHRFYVRDTMGCVRDTTFTLSNTRFVYGIFGIRNASCAGDTDAVITVSGAGGTSPYQYAIAGGTYRDTGNFTGLYPALWTVSIRDSDGCISDTTINVREPNALIATAATLAVSCFGGNDGFITVRAAGGTSPYLFSLNGSPFDTITIFTGRVAGPDTIAIKDTAGCILDTVVTVGTPSPLRWSGFSLTNVRCYNGADGIITVSVSGGTPPYMYSIDGGTLRSTPTFTGLTAGFHLIRVVDANGCTSDTVRSLTQPTSIEIDTLLITNATCEGYADGIVAVYAHGGTPALTYSIDNTTFEPIPLFGTLTEGNYTLFIKDNNGCLLDTTIHISGYPHINFGSTTVKNTTCAGRADGQVNVQATGGIPPLSFILSGRTPAPEAPTTFTGLASGRYTLTVTDSAGCRKDTALTVSAADTMNVLTMMTPNDCIGDDIGGVIYVQVKGGAVPYRYLWVHDSTTNPYIAGMPNGRYTVHVWDNNGCEDSVTTAIEYNDCCVPMVPNAFSPNNDGKNDVFRVKYKGDIRVIEFSVFNRYGQRIYMTEYSEQGWDGTFNNTPCDIGTYFYYIRLICGNKHSTVLEFKGDVSLIR